MLKEIFSKKEPGLIWKLWARNEWMLGTPMSLSSRPCLNCMSVGFLSDSLFSKKRDPFHTTRECSGVSVPRRPFGSPWKVGCCNFFVPSCNKITCNPSRAPPLKSKATTFEVHTSCIWQRKLFFPWLCSHMLLTSNWKTEHVCEYWKMSSFKEGIKCWHQLHSQASFSVPAYAEKKFIEYQRDSICLHCTPVCQSARSGPKKFATPPALRLDLSLCMQTRRLRKPSRGRRPSYFKIRRPFIVFTT